MRLLINTASTLKGGGVQVAKSFMEECRSFPEHDYHIVLGTTLDKLINREGFPANFHFYAIGFRPATRVFSFRSADAFFKTLEKKIQPDVVFTTSGPSYWRPKSPHLMGYNLPHYIYSDSPFFSIIPVWKRLRWKMKGAVIRYFYKRDADALVAQTDDVRDRVRQWVGITRSYTVTNTYGAQYDRPADPAKKILPPRAAAEWRLLMLSAYYSHKNFEIINEVCAILENERIENFRFVVTLSAEISHRVFTGTAQKYIHNAGPVKPEDCPALYRECDFVFLPTLLECFSATYAEGMKMGTPILTSDLSFAHTVCGEAAIYFDPLNAREIVAKIQALAVNTRLQEDLVKKGKDRLLLLLTATQRAERYLEYCRQMVR
jgi:glycosyltransferase involved in cell wall biosynthesis